MNVFDGRSYDAQVLRVIDGDTIECKLKVKVKKGDTVLPFRLSLDKPSSRYYSLNYTDHFRLMGINTPETHGGTKEAGLVAKAFVEMSLNGKSITLKVYKPEKYGRWLADIITEDGTTFNALLVKKGLAKPFMV